MSLDEVKILRAEYKAAVEKARIIAKPVFDAHVAELTKHELVALSKAVHELHASGVPKATINAALGVYSNASLAKPIWDAYSPERVIDLRRKDEGDVVSSDASVPDEVVIPSEVPGRYHVVYDNTIYVFDDVVWDGESVEFTVDFDNEEAYAFGWKALLDYFRSTTEGSER